MRKRVLTGVILALVLIPITVINHPVLFYLFQAVVVALVIVASLEMLAMFDKENKMGVGFKILIIFLTLLTYMNVGALVEPINPVIIPGYSLITLTIHPVVIISFTTIVLFSLLVFSKKFSVYDVGKALTIIYYVGLGSAAITVLRFLGVRFIVYVALISVVTDVFAFLIGIKFGKHKMAPDISPKKSWEGAIGGVIVATLVGSTFAILYGELFQSTGALGSWLNPDNLKTIFDNFTTLGQRSLGIQALVIVPITFMGSIIAQIGDLVASKFKRTYEIKDFGKIFPGHGGVLDRFDSILFIGIFFLSVFIMITLI